MYKSNSYMDDIVDYIKRNLKKGYTKESLAQALLTQNYSKLEIKKAIEKVDEDLAKLAPQIEKPIIKHEIIDLDNIQVEPESFFSKLKRGLGF